MKTKIIILLACCTLLSCGDYNGIPEKYHTLLNNALENAGNNRAEIEKALKEVSGNQREGMAFLISYMPNVDLTSLNAEFLLENVNLAYTARNKFKWAKEIPDSIFFNEVLPYATMNEKRENWRPDFYKRFTPYVENCTTLEEAIRAVNTNIKDELKVEYNTRRRRPDQSPSESIEIGMASCSGLSILLTDALRSVGIPSRIAAAPRWHDNRGNHTWSEVWIDGEWYFTEYYFENLNQAWFLSDAGKAIPGDERYAIFATSFKSTDRHFPLIWARDLRYVHGIDVSQRYIDIYNKAHNSQITSENHVKLTIRAYNNKDAKNSESRIKMNVDIFAGADQIGGGSTAGPTQDMNDVFEIFVEKNKEYTIKYFPEGESKQHTFKVGEKSIDVLISDSVYLSEQ